MKIFDFLKKDKKSQQKNENNSIKEEIKETEKDSTLSEQVTIPKNDEKKTNDEEKIELTKENNEKWVPNNMDIDKEKHKSKKWSFLLIYLIILLVFVFIAYEKIISGPLLADISIKYKIMLFVIAVISVSSGLMFWFEVILNTISDLKKQEIKLSVTLFNTLIQIIAVILLGALTFYGLYGIAEATGTINPLLTVIANVGLYIFVGFIALLGIVIWIVRAYKKRQVLLMGGGDIIVMSNLFIFLLAQIFIYGAVYGVFFLSLLSKSSNVTGNEEQIKNFLLSLYVQVSTTLSNLLQIGIKTFMIILILAAIMGLMTFLLKYVVTFGNSKKIAFTPLIYLAALIVIGYLGLYLFGVVPYGLGVFNNILITN